MAAALGLVAMLACSSPDPPEPELESTPTEPSDTSAEPPAPARLPDRETFSGTMRAGADRDFEFDSVSGYWLDSRLEVSAGANAALELRSLREGSKHEVTLLKVDEAWEGDPERLIYGPLQDRPYVLRIHAVDGLSYTVTTRLYAELTPIQQAWAAAQKQHQLVGRSAGAPEMADVAALEATGQIWLELEQPFRAIAVWHEIAQIFEARDQLPDAIAFYDRSLQRLETLAPLKAKWRAGLLNKRGLAYRKLGQLSRAEEDFLNAKQIATEDVSLSPLAASINNLALLRQDEGRFDEAQRFYEQAIEVLGDPVARDLRGEQATYFENLSRLQTVQDRPDAAARNLERARQLFEMAGDLHSLRRVESERAWQFLLTGREDRALEMLEPVVDYFEAHDPDSMSALVALQRLGLALEATDQPRKAVEAYRRAQRIADHSSFTTAGLGITWCRLAAQLPNPGLDHVCLSGLRELRQLQNRNLLVSALYWRARGLEQRGDLGAALALLSEAAEQLELLRTGVFGRDARARFFESRSDIYRAKVAVVMKRYADTRDRRDAWSALVTSDLLRARVAQDLLGLDSAARGELSAEERRSNHEAIIDLEEQRLQGLHSGLIAMDEEDQELAQLLAHIENRQARAQGGEGARPQLRLEDVQSMLGDDTAVLSLLLGEPQSFLWILTSGRLEAWPLSAGVSLEKGARRFLDQLERGDPETIHSIGTWLAGELFGSGRERLERLEGKRLVFIGEGAFQQLPISALPSSPIPGRRYLVEDFEIVHAPSLATLSTLHTLTRRAPTRSAALLGDPIYDQRSPIPGSLEGLSDQEKRELFTGSAPATAARLPFADLELELVTPFFEDPLVLNGLAATAEIARSSELEDFTLVHVISHGWRDPRFPQLSALLLSEFDHSGDPIDGRLRLREIYELRWRAEMVVASACQTGVGDQLRLAAAGGLARGFLSIGVPRVVVSQWDVDSEATAHLMAAFYKALIVDGAPPGEALRRARLHLLRPEGDTPRHWQSPRLWAAFLLVGDWRSFIWPPESLAAVAR